VLDILNYSVPILRVICLRSLQVGRLRYTTASRVRSLPCLAYGEVSSCIQFVSDTLVFIVLGGPIGKAFASSRRACVVPPCVVVAVVQEASNPDVLLRSWTIFRVRPT